MHHAAAARNATLERRERQRNRESHGESFDRYSRESKAFEESATYEANEDEPSFEQRDFHECPWGGRKRHWGGGGGRAKGRAKSHDEKNERARTRLLQDGWMGLLAMCEGCSGEVELPAIVAELIIVYQRRFGIRYRIMTRLWMLEVAHVKENLDINNNEMHRNLTAKLNPRS